MTRNCVPGAQTLNRHPPPSCLLLLLPLLSAVILAKEKVVPDVVDACTDKAAFKVCGAAWRHSARTGHAAQNSQPIRMPPATCLLLSRKRAAVLAKCMQCSTVGNMLWDVCLCRQGKSQGSCPGGLINSKLLHCMHCNSYQLPPTALCCALPCLLPGHVW
jgi:hypothetical protein